MTSPRPSPRCLHHVTMRGAKCGSSGEAHRKLVDAGIKPLYRIADLAAFGVSIAPGAAPETACALIELESPGQASEFLLGLQNFYVLTRYNRSSLYAASVLELANEIRSRTQSR